MSRLKEFVAPCASDQYFWKCCQPSEKNIINVKKFEQNVRTQLKSDNSSRLLSERNFDLSEKYETMLTIGCCPQYFFDVVARIESQTTNSVMLKSDELTALMEFLSREFKENDLFKSPYDTFTHMITTPSAHYIIDLKAIELRKFCLRIGRKYLTIDEDTLNEILWKKPYIENYISMLEESRKSYQSELLKLMIHFCYDNEILKRAADSLRSKCYIHQFFDEIITFHFACIDKTFAIEIGANFLNWFGKCVPIFIKTKMLNEADRLASFSLSEWPHEKKYINVKKLAKSGLYFTGEKDVVACAFCNVQLHDWKPNDNPVLDHNKFSPKCPFLIDPKRSFNVPIGDERKIEKLLAIIPKNHDYDEPDNAN